MYITKARLTFFLMLTTSLIYLMHKFYYEDWSYYYRYRTIPLEDGSLQRNSYKIILLWTSYQGNWRGWSGGLGHDQIISNCKNTVMNGDCILTSNKTTSHLQMLYSSHFKILNRNLLVFNRDQVFSQIFPGMFDKNNYG